MVVCGYVLQENKHNAATHKPLLLCIGLGFKSGIAPSTLTCNVPSSFAFLVFVFVFCWPFTKLNVRGKVFCKTFRIVELGGTSFTLEFSGQIFMLFLCLFSSCLSDCIVLIWVWFERSLLLTQVRLKSKVSITIKNDVTSSTRDVNLSGWLQTVQG